MWPLINLLFISLPQGAPGFICDTLLPFHGSGIHTLTTVPFNINVSASAVGQGQTLYVEIQAITPELRLGGFMMQASNTSPPYRVIGKFTSSFDGLQKIYCGGVDNTAAYHVSSSSIGNIGLHWQAPNDFLGEVVFNAIIAEEYDKFWVGTKSGSVQVVQRSAVNPATLPRKIDVPDVETKQQNADIIYEGCGTAKTCFGLPSNCLEQQSCQAIVTAVILDDRFQFELKSGVDNVAYVAFGLSTDDQMGDDSVMECIPEGDNIRAYSSWNNRRGNTREGVPQNITSILNSSFTDGTIYCKLERESLTTIQGNEFDLGNNNFHFLVAIGSTVTDSSVTRHDLGRIASSEPLNIIGHRTTDPIYEGCGTTKTCFGLPSNCVEQQSCQAIVTAVVIDGRFNFELKSTFDNAAYIALGLSTDDRMGDDSVMECIPESGNIRTYSSWNNPRPSLGNIREGVPQNTTSLLNSSFIDGTIYCKLEREPLTTIQGNEFDLVNNNFHFVVAVGTTVTDLSITRHDLGRIASSEPLNIIERQKTDPIYEGCGIRRTCFGLPNNCVEQQSCQAIVTAVVHDGRFQFELKSAVDNVAYVALGLSTDDQMGDDSVMECVPEGYNIQAYSSWNMPRPGYGNTREGVPQNITSLLNSSFIDGTIYCKLEREPLTTIQGNEFDLVRNNFHFMVAIGSTVTASSVAYHDLGRIASSEPLNIFEQRTDDPIYAECGTTKTCFGLPKNCVEQQSCKAIVTAVIRDDRFQFELKSGVANVAYVALGLSSDFWMGDDSVMECVPEGGNIRAYSSWNIPRPGFGNTREGVPQSITSLLNSSFIDGTIYCKLEREFVTTILGKQFDLVNNNFHFLIAIGSSVSASSVTNHDLGRIASSEPFDFHLAGSGHDARKVSKIFIIIIWFLATNFTK